MFFARRRRAIFFSDALEPLVLLGILRSLSVFILKHRTKPRLGPHHLNVLNEEGPVPQKPAVQS